VDGVGLSGDNEGCNNEREGSAGFGCDGKSKEWLFEEEIDRDCVLHVCFVLSSILEFF